MNAAEAREAIKIWDDICDSCGQKGIPIPDDEEATRKQMFSLLSKGYLEALEGPEVKALVEAIKFLYQEYFQGQFEDNNAHKPFWEQLRKSLDLYQKAVKE